MPVGPAQEALKKFFQFSRQTGIGRRGDLPKDRFTFAFRKDVDGLSSQNSDDRFRLAVIKKNAVTARELLKFAGGQTVDFLVDELFDQMVQRKVTPRSRFVDQDNLTLHRYVGRLRGVTAKRGFPRKGKRGPSMCVDCVHRLRRLQPLEMVFFRPILTRNGEKYIENHTY